MSAEAFDYSDSRHVSHLVSDRVDPHRILTEEIGPAYADYRRLWDQARTFQTIPPFPLHVDYEMRFSCNLRCPMCLMSLEPAERARFGRADQKLSPAGVMELIDQGAAAGQRAMGFGGLWEPLLEPQLPQIIRHARQRGLVDVMFNTNGLLLTEERGRALIEAGLTKLMISVDAASPEVYSQMRVGSDFQTVVENIERFLALRRSLGRRLPLVRLSFCLTALNEAELPAFVDRWRGRVDFFSIQAYGRYESKEPPPFARSRPDPTFGRCAQPHKRLLVRHDGQVLPCCDASGLGLTLGNVNSQSLAEIWSGPALAGLRRALAEGELPPACCDCREKFGPPKPGGKALSNPG